MSRRALLQVVAATGTLGLAGIGFVALRTPSRPPRPDGLEWLDAQAHAVLSRLAALWLPGGESDFPDWRELPVMEQFDAWLGRLAEPLREQFLLGMAGFDYLGFVRGGTVAPFTALDDERARDYVASWYGGAAAEKGLVTALRQVLHLSYWRHAETWPATGYQGPLYLRADIPALGAAPRPAS